ncbi:MAG: hypothetical protein FJ010_03935 [Chloroflexi bacterium]|nr:hypothetical protein [Chloroflexota bacterium]
MMQWIAAVFLGWLGGMVVNYLSDILPHERRLAAPICMICGEKQPWWNYLVWPRRCPACGGRRRLRVWIVEIIYIGVSVWLWISPPVRLGAWVGIALMLYFGVVVVIDMEHRLILHPVSWTGALLGLAVGSWLHGLTPTLIGGAAGYGLMLILYGLGFLFARGVARFRGEPIEEVALGFGDVNLSGVLGLLLGWPGIIGGLILAILLGGVVSFFYLLVTLLLRRYRVFTAIPYGPFLVCGAIGLLYFNY